jgi:hypothetical protein
MNITRNNCESFFLDYYEKTLSPVEVAEVLFFLEENPDLKEVFESYEAISLEQDKAKFPDKDSLKKKYNNQEIEAILSSEINQSNCEQFFAAAAEGILSATQAQRLNLFLEQYPELKKEFELFQKCKLTPEKIVFENKDLLKKEAITVQNREEYFIRSIERDLNLTEQKQLAAFLQKNPEYKKDFELFKKTILVPEKISFEFKSELKKKEERKPVFISIFSQRTFYYAAAASILLIAGLFFIFRGRENAPAYLANNSIHTPAIIAKSVGQNKTSTDRKEIVPQGKEHSNKESEQITIRKNISASKNIPAPLPTAKENKIIPQPLSPETKIEENLVAKKEEEKKSEEIESPVIAKNPKTKTDSLTTPASQDQAQVIASAVKTKSDDEYQTIASVVNKKLRSILGISKSTECETSDKIGLWDLAMAVKRGIQNRIGTKAVDVEKVCDGTNNKVEYVFAAGNFGITKSISR